MTGVQTCAFRSLNTYTPGVGWVRRGGPWPNIRFAPGDRFGARAWTNGRVVILRNGLPVCEGSLSAWSSFANGGRIGMILNGAAGTRITRFGGGAFADSIPPIVLGNPDIPPILGSAAAAGREDLPRSIQLSQIYPNPVTHIATFAIELPRASRVGFVVYDIGGRSVWSQTPREMPAGHGSLRWPGSDARGSTAAVGVYLARVTIDRETFTRRIVVIR